MKGLDIFREDLEDRDDSYELAHSDIINEYIELIYNPVVDTSHQDFSNPMHKDMIIRLFRFFFDKEFLGPRHIRCHKKRITLNAFITSNYEISLRVSIRNPTFLPFNHVEIDVCPAPLKNDLTRSRDRDINVSIAKNMIHPLLLSEVEIDEPSYKNLEQDLMEWLIDYTNIEELVDL